MSEGKSSVDPRSLHQEVRDIWERNALWWDDKIGEGNDFQNILIGPATERLLDLRPGELVLDVACGAGLFSRRMAQLGARVVAFDFSGKFIQRARERTKEHTGRIEYRVADATDEAQLLQLGERRFDAAVCTMALMDMATIEPLMSVLSRLLKVGGRFVFSVMHPCFNQMGCKMTVEEEYRDGELVPVHAVKVMSYIRPATDKGLGIVGQPVPQYYFHRPISALFNTCFRAGFVLDGMEEPIFGLAADGARPFSWVNYREIPPVLIARMRLL